jgi:hypothetical protein
MLSRWIPWSIGTATKPDRASLRLQVASMLSTFATIRGWATLLSPQTATVMRRQFETFITADLNGLERPETIVAVVYLKDVECFEGIKEIQSDKGLRGSALSNLALNHLADQVTEALLRQVTKTGSEPAPEDKSATVF